MKALFALVTVVLAVALARHDPPGPVWALGWASVFALRMATGRRTALAGAAAMVAVLGATALIGGEVLLPVVFLGWSAAAFLLADAIRARADRTRAVKQAEERQRVAEERLRIARDLHDGVAHAMATINVQAAAASHVLAKRPEAAGAALAAIRQASGEALDELTAMLKLLREPAARAPAPGLGTLAELAGTVRAAGLPVSLTVDGPVETVPGAVGTAAYRIVQESLTNVVRHAGASRALVTVTAGERGLTVEVRDDGAGARDWPGAGVGITGMRERAESTGGRLAAGPIAGGGFRVGARWE
nr:histidine kinase [uncultured Actinoplanes sp.]